MFRLLRTDIREKLGNALNETMVSDMSLTEQRGRTLRLFKRGSDTAKVVQQLYRTLTVSREVFRKLQCVRPQGSRSEGSKYNPIFNWTQGNRGTLSNEVMLKENGE